MQDQMGKQHPSRDTCLPNDTQKALGIIQAKKKTVLSNFISNTEADVQTIICQESVQDDDCISLFSCYHWEI